MTKEQEADSKQRIEAFQKEYVALTEKYQVDFVSFPFYLPTANGIFSTGVNTQLVDKKNMPAKSPLKSEDIIK